MKKIVVFSLGLKGLHALQSLGKQERNYITKVVIGKDPNLQEDYSGELEQWCINQKIDYVFRGTEIYLDQFDFVFALGWRWMLPVQDGQSLIIFHDSLLPRYRGFNPIVSALINGDKEIGLSCLLGEGAFDTGAVINQYKLSIQYPIKIAEVIEKLGKGYGILLNGVLRKIISNAELVGKEQDEASATYSVWRDEEDYVIDWTNSSDKIERIVNAVGFPYKGARTQMDGEIVVLTEVQSHPNYVIENNGIGKVLMKDGDHPYIVCGSGLLKILEIRDLNGELIPFPRKFRYRCK